ncbi:MAG: hypothetical protein ACYCSG_04780 [Thermoplasmataceae archaeon]
MVHSYGGNRWLVRCRIKGLRSTIIIGHFTVYEVIDSGEFWAQGHKRSDYIANGILVDRKLY